MRGPLALSLVAALLASCPESIPLTQSSFPAEVKDFPELNRFPEEVAGFHRDQIVAYAPNMSAYSIAYNRDDLELQNAVTLYFGPRLADTAAQLLAEKKAVIDAHPDSRVISERVLNLSKDGRTYEATMTFEYSETFARRLQNVRSFLLVTFTPRWRVKVRSTTPINQGARAESKLLPFLEGVSWAQ